MYQSWESGAGMIQAGFTEAAAWSPLSTQDALGAGMKTHSPGARGAAGRGVDQSARTGIPAPHLGAPDAQVRRPGPASSGTLPARGLGIPAAVGRFGRVSRAETGSGASPGRRGRGLAATGGPAGSVPPAFVLAAARGARPGR